MKLLKSCKYWHWLAIFALPLIVVACMTIEEIIHPDDPKVNSEIEITVKIKLVTETDETARLVFAVLAPKSWNIAQSAKLTLTTEGYASQGYADVVNEEMSLMADTDLEPTTALKWSEAYQSKIGLMGNLGPVEWVVFKSQTVFIINDKVSTDPINGTVKIRFTTGSQNLKCFMGYGFCGMKSGFNGERYKANERSKVLTVTGGSNPMIDYTTVSLVSTVPSVFRYGDIFSVKFESVAGTTETALKGVEKVYIYGRAIYNDGQVAEVDAIGDATLMEKIGETTYQKYIYPRHFFNLPDDAVITATYFHFTNGDKSIVVKDTTGDDFLISQSEE